MWFDAVRSDRESGPRSYFPGRTGPRRTDINRPRSDRSNRLPTIMMIEAMEDVEEGVRVGRQLLKDVKLADDQGMVVQTEKGLQRIMDALSKTTKEYYMEITVKNTKVIRACRNGNKLEGGNSINITI